MTKTAEELRVYKIEKKAEIEASIPAMIDSLVKIARDPSEARTLIMHVVDAKQEDLIPSIVNMSQSRESDIAEASLCDLGEDKVAAIKGILADIDEKKKLYAEVDSISKVAKAEPIISEVEKVAIPVVKPALWLGKKLFQTGKLGVKGAIGTGKFMWNKPKTTLALTGVAGAAMAADAHKEKILHQIM